MRIRGAEDGVWICILAGVISQSCRSITPEWRSVPAEVHSVGCGDLDLEQDVLRTIYVPVNG